MGFIISKFLQPHQPPQVTDEQTESMDVFYKTAADTTLHLKDGQILKFNKAALVSIVKSSVLYQIFFGEFKVEETKIEDIEYDTFKLFLDCVMGYKKFDFEKAFKVFPVFHKYQVEHLLSECIESLIPNGMNEKVCDVLNLTGYYTCDKLTEKLSKFLVSNNIPEFLEDKNYFQLLQPDAWKIILNSFTIDSGLLMILAKWGINYMKENSLNFETSRHFFEKHDLLKFFKLEYFETTGAISEFCLSEAGKDILTVERVLSHVHNSKDLLHRKSKWINVEKNGEISERITMPSINKSGKFVLQVKVKRNRAVFYREQLPEGKKQKEEEGEEEEDKKKEEELEIKISCKIRFGSGYFLIHYYETTFMLSERDLEFDMIQLNYERSTRNYNSYFDITWKFLQKCRVLLTTLEGDEFNNDEMFFTKDILACF